MVKRTTQAVIEPAAEYFNHVFPSDPAAAFYRDLQVAYALAKKAEHYAKAFAQRTLAHRSHPDPLPFDRIAEHATEVFHVVIAASAAWQTPMQRLEESPCYPLTDRQAATVAKIEGLLSVALAIHESYAHYWRPGGGGFSVSAELIEANWPTFVEQLRAATTSEQQSVSEVVNGRGSDAATTTDDECDKWLNDLAEKGRTWSAIRASLATRRAKARFRDWPELNTDNGIKLRVAAYRRRTGKRPLESRKQGRPAKRKPTRVRNNHR